MIKNITIHCIFFFISSVLFSNVTDLELDSSKKHNEVQAAWNSLRNAEKIQFKNIQEGNSLIIKDLKNAERLNNDTLAIYASKLLTIGYQLTRQYDSSIMYAQICKKYLQVTKDLEQEIIINCILSLAYSKEEKFDSAFIYINNSETIFNENDSIKKNLYIFHKIRESFIFYSLKSYSLALQKIDEANEFAKKINDSIFTYEILASYAKFHYETENYDTAISYLKKSLTHINPNSLDKSIIFSSIASSYKEKGLIDSTLTYYIKAIDHLKKANSENEISVLYLKLTQLYFDIDLNKAKHYFSLIKANDLKYHEACLYQFYKIKLYSDQSNIITQTEKLVSCSKNIAYKKRIHLFLYKEYKKINDNNNSLIHFEKYNQINDSILKEENNLAVQKAILENLVQKKENKLVEANINNVQQNSWLKIVLTILFFITLLSFIVYYLYKSQVKKHSLAEKEKELVKKELTQLSFSSMKDKKFIKHAREELKSIKKSSEKEKIINSLYAQTNLFVMEDKRNGKIHEHLKKVEDVFFEKIDSKSKLTKTEKKLILLLKFDMTTKEIAPVLNVSEKTIEKYRYILRKKLNIDRNITFHEYLNSI